MAKRSAARLGEFIRLRRERLSPERVGLDVVSRRRTPGLRREELAQLCQVSVTWITWLEQGRDVTASSAALSRISKALQLNAAEREYLFKLANELDPEMERIALPVKEPFLLTVHFMESPAYILDHRWDVIAFNQRADDLFSRWGSHPDETPNLLRFMFTDPRSRKLVVDWKSRAKRLVAEFRADCGRKVESWVIQDLVADLSSQSKEFSFLWAQQDVLAREGGERSFHHPKLGKVLYDQVTLLPAINSGIKVVMLIKRKESVG